MKGIFIIIILVVAVIWCMNNKKESKDNNELKDVKSTSELVDYTTKYSKEIYDEISILSPF